MAGVAAAGVTVSATDAAGVAEEGVVAATATEAAGVRAEADEVSDGVEASR